MSFDRIAPFYGTLERIAFGNALQRARVAFLNQLTGSSRVLVVGEGNGRFLAELLRANPAISVDCLDASAEMLRLAQKRSHRAEISGRLRFHRAEIIDWQPPSGDYDLLVTHFFLDCFNRERLSSIIEKISSLAAINARWLISDFNLPPGRLRRWHARAWLYVMYLFFHLASDLPTRKLAEFAPILRAQGFRLIARRDSRFGLITAQMWQC